MESLSCDFCESNRTQLIYTVSDTNYGTPGQFQIVQCVQCGLIYVNPRLRATELEHAYPEDSYDPFQAIHKASGIAIPNQSHQKRADWLTTYCGVGRLLDVGCGDGLFLEAMHQRGWDCRGVEPNVNAVRFANTVLKICVTKGDIFAIDDETMFDLITLWDVLEHTPSPTDVIKRAHSLLATQGKIVLSVPNWDSIERRVFRERWIGLDAPRHLYHFTLQTITRLLRTCGFEIVSWEAKAPVLSLASNILRAGGDFLLRKGKPKTSIIKPQLASANPKRSIIRLAIIRLVHVLMASPNAGINLLQKGAGITVMAQKAPHP